MVIALVVAILLVALVFGVFFGPWLALTRSISTFEPPVFLAVVHRMDRNLGAIMTVLFPLAIASIAAALALSWGQVAFWPELAALAGVLVSLAVTMAVEVPVVAQVRGWQLDTLPDNWTQLRDRWVSFHLLRIIPGFLALGLLVIALATS